MEPAPAAMYAMRRRVSRIERKTVVDDIKICYSITQVGRSSTRRMLVVALSEVGEMKSWSVFGLAATMVFLSSAVVRADLLPVQNATFSRPLVSLAQQASPFLQGTGWTTNGPELMEFPPGSGYWVNIGTLVWQNPPVGAYNHVDNLITDPTVSLADDPDPSNYPYQGAASLGAQTGNEFSQLLTSSFEPGLRYSLTMGAGRNFGNAEQVPAVTAALRLALYYLDDGSDRQIVTSVDIFNNASTGLSANHMLDFSTPEFVVGANDAAAGRKVGILLTTIGPAGGYFNVSNVRVAAVPEPASACVLLAGSVLLLRRRCVRVIERA
jgi:hypothetical protein